MIRFVTALALGMPLFAPLAQATLLVYEPFNYTTGTPSGPTNNGFLLAGQSGGSGFSGAWSTFNNGSTPITVYPGGALTGTDYDTNFQGAGLIVPYTFTGSVTNLPTSGGFFGPGGSNTTDHMEVWRSLDPSVTATFTDGSTTWFSFVSSRGYTANPSGMKLALGHGHLTEDRGLSASGEAIGGGTGLGGSERNVRKVYPQYWDSVPSSPGETTGSFDNYDVQGKEGGSQTTHYISAPYTANGLPVPSNDSNGLQSMLVTTLNPTPYIVVGKIEWRANGTPDIVSVVKFLQTDTLSEDAFNAAIIAQPLLCSANWPDTVTVGVAPNQTIVPGPPKPDLDQSKFDTLSLAGGKFFADEVRLSTTFSEVVGVTPPVLAPFNLTVVGTAPTLDFKWNSQSGKRYNLKCSPDLATSPSTWALVQGAIVPTPPFNTLTIPRPADPKMFYVVEEVAASLVPHFTENFDSGATGWSNGYDAADSNHLTTWQLGTPTNVGPLAANSPPDCYGTNIAANYGFSSNIWLRSPAIDLTAFSSATLQLKQWMSCENAVGDGDYGAIRILSAADDSLLAVLEADVEGGSTAWQSYSKDLPFIAFTKPIKLEFRFHSDDYNDPASIPPPPFAGWYIDDVVILVPGS